MTTIRRKFAIELQSLRTAEDFTNQVTTLLAENSPDINLTAFELLLRICLAIIAVIATQAVRELYRDLRREEVYLSAKKCEERD